MTHHPVIAIDGPAASGKSSVAKALARRLGVVFVNTGAMYRAVTWLAIRSSVNVHDESAVLALWLGATVEYGVADHQSTLRVNGEDLSPHLGSAEVNANVSAIAALPAVREELVARQRDYAVTQPLVMEGRDIGTVVFPHTPYKFYIDASLEVRSRRRAAQGLHDDLATRDRLDASRAASPLRVADGAEVIDSSELSIEGVVDAIVERLVARGYAPLLIRP